MENCSICLEDVLVDDYTKHREACYNEQVDLLKQLEKNKEAIKQIAEDELIAKKMSGETNLGVNNSASIIDSSHEDLVLTPMQEQALTYCHKKSKIFSRNILPNLFKKFAKRGLGIEDMKAVYKYIQKDMQIVVHVNLQNVLQFLVKDTHYKNTFEVTKTDNIPGRIDWENNLFNSVYNKCPGGERVKYGALNLTNNPTGVPPAYSYGNSFMILKNEVKARTTFVYGDSAAKDIHMCNFKNFNSVLYYIPDNLLDDIISIALGKKQFTNTPYPFYIEMQIHGPLRLGQDVEVLVVNSKSKNAKTTKLLEAFNKAHGVPYAWMDDIK
jgi:hypothetical protein